ncbi:hypothetical protein Cni_G06540 [Canna indica]|uniref:Uncharacterized protein n=1 Tax=Canna indica TaxID=4628 RepID=A0AAQ3JZI0_9LILI|nr:hypothetical protein Cni_G06540 [Canna indica]
MEPTAIPGTRRFHRRTLDAMRLCRYHRNTSSLLGILNQVKRLVVVEMEAMYNARKQKDEENRALRPPIVVSHSSPAPPSAAALDSSS